MARWSDSEVIGPRCFDLNIIIYSRMEPFRISRGTRALCAHRRSGMQDVAAIVVDMAVIEPKSKVLLTDAQIATLTTRQRQFLVDYSSGMIPGQLRTRWQSTAQWSYNLPSPAISGIRLYERYFYLSPREIFSSFTTAVSPCTESSQPRLAPY